MSQEPYDALVVHPDLRMMGGSETVALLVLRALRADGQRTALLSRPVAEPEIQEEITRLGDRVDRIVMNPTRPRRFGTYPEFWRLKRELGERIVPARNIILTQALLPVSSARTGAQVVLYAHYPSLRSLEATPHGLLGRAYLWPAKRWLERHLRRVDVVLANSEFTRQAIKHAWGKWGLPEPVVVHPAPVRNFEGGRTWASRRNRVVYVARLTRFKRHDLLKDIARRFPQTEFVSIGSSDPSYESHIRELRQDAPRNYAVVPNARRADVRRYLEESRVYAHLAPDEHFGIAAVEAMRAGAVPLVHDSGGIREVVPAALRWKNLDDLSIELERYLEDEGAWTRRHHETRQIGSGFTPERFAREFNDAVRAK